MHKQLIVISALISGCTFNVYQPSINTNVDAQAQVSAINNIAVETSQPISTPGPTWEPTPNTPFVDPVNLPASPEPTTTALSEYRDDYFSFKFPAAAAQIRSANGNSGYRTLDNKATYEVSLEILSGAWLSQYDRLKKGAPGRLIKSAEIKLDGQPGYLVESVTAIDNRDRIYVDLSGTCLGRIIHIGILSDEDLSGELTGDALVNKIAPTWRWNLSAPQLSR